MPGTASGGCDPSAFAGEWDAGPSSVQQSDRVFRDRQIQLQTACFGRQGGRRTEACWLRRATALLMNPQ
jgi:hypothetical protein